MSTNIENGIYNGFIDSNKEANIDYIPTLLTNEPEEGMKVFCDVVKELNRCIEFKFSVAFLTMSGIQILYNTLNKLKADNIKGTIVVSQYQNFTEPKALRKLLKFDNIELRIVTNQEYKLHTKGYIFKYPNGEYSIIVGSSNLTQNALCVNKEWNVKLNTLSDGSYAKVVMDRFNEMYDISILVTNEFIDGYEKIYNSIKKSYVIDDNVIIDTIIKPNSMQKEALESLNNIRLKGQNKALAISSTGTGKTILSALDVAQFNPKKMLFVVHRENILHAAIKAFKRVLGKDISTSIFAGSKKDIDAKYIFAMVQTLSKDNNLELFNEDEFDYIIFDEAHRLGNSQTRKVFEYFNPKFVLGMTATPERMDGYDIFKLFNYNIACEIRLNDAMKEDLICPFHYYGVSDIEIDGELIDDNTEFNRLVSKDRVEHIINKISEYGFSGNNPKGLIFVSRVEEAKELSKLFNEKGFNTVALSGDNSEAERAKAIESLESDDVDSLDYIFTRDIFNEGIDIPKVNQIIMLRPTESAIIFVQQLGRGLRKNNDKEYLVVLDFIGNYDNNFLIPIALSGDRSYNKDNLRRFIKEGNKTIYGASTIEFEEVVEKKIFEKLDKVNFNDARFIKESYVELKNKLGRIPSLMDFLEYDSIDPNRIFDKYGSYHNFLSKYEDNYKIQYSNEESLYLELISTKYGTGKMVYEVEFIKYLMTNDYSNDGYITYVENKYPNYKVNDLLLNNIINQMTGEYFVSSEKKKFANIIFIENNKKSKIFNGLLNDNDFVDELNDLLDFIIFEYNHKYNKHYKDTLLTLNEKYTYDDVLRLLNFNKNEVSLNIGGYKCDDFTNTIPVFINYNKNDDISDSIKYEDRFESRELLHWVSKNGRTLQSNDVKTIINSNTNNTKIYLFVRKNKDDSQAKEFYFLGRMYVTDNYKEITMESGHKAVEFLYKLDEPVREELYDYITSK